MNSDINVTNVVVRVNVTPLGNISSYDWFVGYAFWHFNLKNPTLLPLEGSFLTQGNTLIRMEFKKFELRLLYPALKIDTSLLDPIGCGDIVFRKNRLKFNMMKDKSSNYFSLVLGGFGLASVHQPSVSSFFVSLAQCAVIAKLRVVACSPYAISAAN